MDSFLIRGGNRLKGKIEISGSKNSALPIMAATLMAEGKTTLKGVPRLSRHRFHDQAHRRAGLPHLPPRADRPRQRVARPSTAPWTSKSSTKVNAKPATTSSKPCAPASACSARCLPSAAKPSSASPAAAPSATVPSISTSAACKNSARIPHRKWQHHRRSPAAASKAAGCTSAAAQGPTVLGTINVMCAAALAEGETVLVGAACEPEVSDCADMLNKMGARSKATARPKSASKASIDSRHRTSHHPRPHRVRHLHDRRRHHQWRTRTETLQSRSPDCRHRSPGRSGRRASSGKTERSSSPRSPVNQARGDDNAAVPRVSHRPAGPAHGAAVPVRWHQRHHRAQSSPTGFLHVGELNRMGARIRKEGPTAIIQGVQGIAGRQPSWPAISAPAPPWCSRAWWPKAPPESTASITSIAATKNRAEARGRGGPHRTNQGRKNRRRHGGCRLKEFPLGDSCEARGAPHVQVGLRVCLVNFPLIFPSAATSPSQIRSPRQAAQAPPRAALQQSRNRLSPARPIVQRPIVHIHPHKLIRQFPIRVPAQLQRILHRLGAMIQAELN